MLFIYTKNAYKARLARLAILIVVSFVSSGALACLESPLPTSPTGPRWTIEYTQPSVPGPMVRTEYTFWRHICPSTEPLLLVTVTNHLSTPRICGGSVFQAGRQYRNVSLLLDPSDPESRYCDNIDFRKATFAVENDTSIESWDARKGFRFGVSSALNRVSGDVGAFSSSDYEFTKSSKEVKGIFSGSWFDPTRNGEGLVIEVSEAQDEFVMVVYWFTHKDGVPFWLIGMEQFEAEQKAISMGLTELFGTGFGGDFASKDIQQADFGILDLQFLSCSEALAEWTTNAGETGSFELRRITTTLEGASCE